MQNASYQAQFGIEISYKGKCLKFYDVMKALYLETDACRVGLGAGQPQTREGTICLRG